MPKVGGDLSRAAAWLAGRDMGQILADSSAAALAAILRTFPNARSAASGNPHTLIMSDIWGVLAGHGAGKRSRKSPPRWSGS